MEVPKHYLKKRFLLGTVWFNTLFSIGFLFLYQPFSSTFWINFSSLAPALYSIGFYLSCIVLLVASKLVLHKFWKDKPMNVSSLVFCLAAEFVGIAILYLLFTKLMGYQSHSSVPELLLRTSSCVALILIIPYIIMFLYASNEDKKEEIRILKLNEQVRAKAPETPLINLYDHSGVLRISTAQDDIFFIEAQDNYVSINYREGDSLKSYLLRSSTSEIEESLKGTPIIRCHRSYLVNLNHIKMLQHGKGKAAIILSDKDGSEVPVSRTYYKDLLDSVVPDKIVRRA